MNMGPLSISSAKTSSAEAQPLTLKEGQMIHGKVQQLFPGQMAQVQVGNQQLHAKLEVPLQAGDHYYFKVNGTEPELKLQVISGPIKSTEGQAVQLSKLMESMNLPKTPEMKELLAMVIKQKIPMTRENLLEAANLLKSVPENMKSNAFAVISKIAEARLPFTPVVFQSLLQAQTGTITQQLTTLQAAILQEPNLPPAVRGQLLQTLQALANPVSQSVGKELLHQSISKLVDPQASKADRFAALQLVKSANILPPRASLANLPQILAQLVTQTGAEKVSTPMTVVSSAMTDQSMPKALQNLVQQVNQTPATNQSTVQTVIQNLAQQLTNSTVPASVKNTLQTLLAQFTNQPVTESSKSAFIQQFNQVFAMSEQSSATPVSTSQSSLNQTASQINATTQLPIQSNPTMAVVQTIQNTLSQLNQTSVTNGSAMKEITHNLTQQLNQPTVPELIKNALQPIVQQFSQQLPSESVKAAFIEQFSQTLLQQVSAQETSTSTASTIQVPKEMQQVIPSLLSLPPERVEDAMRTLLQIAEKSTAPEIKQMIQAAEVQLSQAMNGPVMKEAMQSIVSTLGLNYEALLNSKEPELTNLANTLKPQLLALLQDSTLSPQLREATETMVLRMNGTIIQTADTSIQQQIIMQLPVELFGKKIDATLQWNGRMKENGQIDPAFARIIFYLDLESLKTTMVDMHVQNKVVNLTIFNEQPSLRTSGLSLQPLLKEGLERVGYKLSGITFKPFTESQQTVKPVNIPHTDEGGVDYRI